MDSTNAVAMPVATGSALGRLFEQRPVIFQLLRFSAIGALNTAIDFVVLNLLTESLGIQEGVRLGLVNIVGTTLAIIQSYYWNKYWAFAVGQATSWFKQLVVVVFVGGLGFCTFVAAVLPSASTFLSRYNFPYSVTASGLYFGIVLSAFLLVQIVVAANMGFMHTASNGSKDSAAAAQTTAEFLKFIAVSVIGVIINSLVLTLLVAVILHLYPDVAESLAKNLAKFIAVFVALSWNFIGYKFFVFRR